MTKLKSGDKSVIAFQEWMATMTDDDYRQIVRGGKLNREQIAKGVGIAKAALRQNPRVAQMLVDLENGLRIRGVLPPMTDEGKKKVNQPSPYFQEATSRSIDARRVAKLERKNLELKTENSSLRKENSSLKKELEEFRRYKEVAEAIAELGIMPR